jgi:hypothetical protein
MYEYGRSGEAYPDEFFPEDPERKDFVDEMMKRKKMRSNHLNRDFDQLISNEKKMFDIFLAYESAEALERFGLPDDFQKWWVKMEDLGPIQFLRYMTGAKLPQKVFWAVWAHGMQIQFPEIIAGKMYLGSSLGHGTKTPPSRVMTMAINFLRAQYYECHDLDFICGEKYVKQAVQNAQMDHTQVCELCNDTHMFPSEVLWCDNCKSSWHEWHKFVTVHTYEGCKTISAEANMNEENRRTWICPYCVNESIHGTQGQVVRRAHDKLNDPDLSAASWPGGREKPTGPAAGGKGLMGWPYVAPILP